MNAAEIKLDLFRKIDSLKESDLEIVYNKLISLLNSTSSYKLSNDEKAAIEKSLRLGESESSYSSEEIKQEARQKYPNLKFK